jgi:hypothetical protein
MSESYKKSPSREGQIILDTLQDAVNKALDKKRRLGQYAVVWKNGAPSITDNKSAQESASKLA